MSWGAKQMQPKRLTKSSISILWKQQKRKQFLSSANIVAYSEFKPV